MSFQILDDSELPLILDDLPNFKLKLDDADSNSSSSDHAKLETAKQFLEELNSIIQEKNTTEQQKEQLYALYDFKFNQTCSTTFKDAEWPAPDEIEREYEIDFDVNTIFLYNELCYRHALARLSPSNIDTGKLLAKSWDNYVDIFDTILNAKHNIPLPVPWIWDIIDEYIYQFYFACRWRRTIQNQDETFTNLLNQDEDLSFWNLEDVLSAFQRLIQKSQILKDGPVPQLNVSDDGSATTNEYFGYFAIVGLQRVYILIGNFEKAVSVIESIDFKSLLVFSKAVPSYLTLFYYTGFCYLMTRRFKQSVRLFEAIILFINKYKPFMTKTFQFDNMSKQLDKTLVLLVLSLVFYPTEIDDSINQLLKETSFKGKDRKDMLFDKFEKLNKFDDQSFNELFSYGVPKIIEPIQSMDDFKKMGFDHSLSEVVNQTRSFLSDEFKKVQGLNNISSILKLYTRIQISKVAQLLNISVDELQKNLDLYRLRNNSELRDVPFEQSIIKQFLGNQQKIDFKVQNEILTVTEVIPAQNYTAYFAKTSIQLEQIINELESIY